MEIAINALILGVLGLAAMQLLASRGFRARMLSFGAKLRAAPPVTDVSATLPPLVRDFALRSGAEPGSGLRTASFTQSGTFRMKRGGAMAPLSAWQVVSLGAPGFTWDGRIEGGTLRQVRVLDAFVDGAGMLEARLLGSLRLARSEGAEATLGEAYRYLAELPWVPDAILGNPSVLWRMVGPRRAEAAMETAAGRAVVAFDFDDAGDIVQMTASGRPSQDEKGQFVNRDWRGRFSDYAQIGPRRVPGAGEVGYVHPDGYEMYFRARIADYRLTA